MAEFQMQQAPEESPEIFLARMQPLIGKSVSTEITETLNDALSFLPPVGLETGFTGKVSAYIEAPFKGRIFPAPGNPNFVIRADASLLRPSSQEGATGADLAIYFEVLYKLPPPYSILRSKTLLVQAKTGSINDQGELKCSNPDLRKQITTIERISPNDGFLLVFTPGAGYCVGIQDAIAGLNGGTLTTKAFHPAGEMIGRLVSCSAGNTAAISPKTLQFKRAPTGRIFLDDANEKLKNYGNSTLQAPFSKPKNAVSISLEIKKKNP